MIVLLHGWGLHGGVFEPLAAALGDDVTCPDLPGHGGRPFAPGFSDLAGLAAAVATGLPARCTLAGWSLGGMVAAALAAAHHPAVERLVLLDSTPRFVNGDGWTAGLEREVVEQFAADLRHDYRRLVARFLALQAHGDAEQAGLLRQLRAAVFARGEPDPAALAAGLDVLLQSDLRDAVGRIEVPTLVMAGTRDRLTPPAASAWTAAHVPHARLHWLQGAGHAPFLTRPDAVASAIRAFLGDGSGERVRA